MNIHTYISLSNHMECQYIYVLLLYILMRMRMGWMSTSTKCCKKIFMKDVGMVVPKSVETRKHPCSIHAAKQRMKACNNNNMRNPLPTFFISYGVMHVIIVLLHGCFLVSTLFGTTIPTSFNIYFTTLVSLVFTVCS